MVMDKKLNKDLIDDLSSKDNSLINKALKKLRKSGNVAYLPYVFAIFDTAKDQSILNELEYFLSDVKNEHAKPYFVERITNNDTGLKQILTACWSSGINYTSNLDTFVNAFIRCDIIIALEAYSVIEEWAEFLDNDTAKSFYQQLNKASANMESTKQSMAIALCDTLKR